MTLGSGAGKPTNALRMWWFADLGWQPMPGNATTDVELPALRRANISFACSMNTVHGLLRLRRRKWRRCGPRTGLLLQY